MNPAESLPLMPSQAWNLTKVAQAGRFVNNFDKELDKRPVAAAARIAGSRRRTMPAARPSRRSLLMTGAAGIAAGLAAAVGIDRLTPKPPVLAPRVASPG